VGHISAIWLARTGFSDSQPAVKGSTMTTEAPEYRAIPDAQFAVKSVTDSDLMKFPS
jgi:hypothetical protein